MGNENIFDPMDAQLEDLDNLSLQDLNLTSPVDPQIVNLFIQQNRYRLIELKAAKGDTANLRSEINQLRESNENLKIKIAESKSNDLISWAEIFISLLGGFAINRLTTSFDVIGLVTLVLCFVVLIIFRIPKISLIFGKKTEK